MPITLSQCQSTPVAGHSLLKKFTINIATLGWMTGTNDDQAMTKHDPASVKRRPSFVRPSYLTPVLPCTEIISFQIHIGIYLHTCTTVAMYVIIIFIPRLHVAYERIR